MKCRLFVAVILIVAAFVVGRQVNRWKGVDGAAAGLETRQSYRLGPGARVEVRGINGPVEINTAATDTADVRVAYTGGSPEDSPRVVVEHDESSLVVRGEGRGGGFWRWLRGGGEVRVAVVMTVPRRSEVTAKGVNGPVEVGDVEGSVRVTGVNGRVEVGEVAGPTEVAGVNGNVKFGVSRLAAEGLEVKGVNGNVEVFLRSSVDADLEVKGHNGQMLLNVPNVTMQEREGHSRMRARLGAGGASINIKGVNGNVRFESGATAASTSSLPPPPPPAPPLLPRAVPPGH